MQMISLHRNIYRLARYGKYTRNKRKTIVVAEIVAKATSRAAAKFLCKVFRDMLFAVKSIQGDGGSEFIKHFENLK